MSRYLLTESELVCVDRPGTTAANAVASITLIERKKGNLTVVDLRWESLLPPIETMRASVTIDEVRVAILARDIPRCLQEKVIEDYGLDLGAVPWVQLYKLQAAVYAIGLELIKGHQLASGDLVTRLESAKCLGETVPWVALALMREGFPYMRWWEEQAENFIDLWFSPFRLRAGTTPEPSPEGENPHRGRRHKALRASPRERISETAPFSDVKRSAADETIREATDRISMLEGKMETMMNFLGLRE